MTKRLFRPRLLVHRLVVPFLQKLPVRRVRVVLRPLVDANVQPGNPVAVGRHPDRELRRPRQMQLHLGSHRANRLVHHPFVPIIALVALEAAPAGDEVVHAPPASPVDQRVRQRRHERRVAAEVTKGRDDLAGVPRGVEVFRERALVRGAAPARALVLDDVLVPGAQRRALDRRAFPVVVAGTPVDVAKVFERGHPRRPEVAVVDPQVDDLAPGQVIARLLLPVLPLDQLAEHHAPRVAGPRAVAVVRWTLRVLDGPDVLLPVHRRHVAGATLGTPGGEDEEDEDGEKKEEKDADGVKEDEPADPDEFDFPTLSDESKRGMATTRMHAVVYHCNHWADAIKNVQEYVNSLSPEEREKRSAVVNGVAEIDAMIRACHGESILDHPKDLEALAQAGKWRRFKKEIEDLYSKRVCAKVAELSSTPGAVTQQTVSELEKIQDSIGKAFAAMIKNAEAELIARTPGGKDGLRLTTTPVPVKHADDLTLEEFVEEHAIPGKPVVIRGLKMINPDKPWTLEHIADACGGVKVRLNTKSATTTNWGGLVDAGRMPLNDFARRVETDPALRTWYLHDWSLNRYCPAIFGPPPYTEFTMPKYFAGDYFQRVPWIGYEQTWPSLFIGANATSSALHVDSGATNFWMYLMTGKKLWRFWDREQLFNLYHKPFTAHFRFRAFDVDLSRNPLLADAPMYEVVQEPGDLVFVPANSPHAVHNLDDITALSMNYVDSTNLWLYLADLVKDEAWEEIEMFDVDTAPFGLVKSQKDLSFGEFKSQRVTWERRNAEYRAGERFAKGERVPVWLD
mmetsp:Transcript_10722/g.46421  ORF Transcript_10722/g.46421 Transcript_10722/m.46421 type:complete len:795 (-) Transcript_10722:49-2433(-)